MRRLRKKALTLLVALTAVSTLAAGMPYSLCRCPNGHEKWFCFSSASETTKCCCGGSCCGNGDGAERCRCGSRGDGAQSASCCSKPRDRDPGTPSETGPQAHTNCCTKTLVQADIVSVIDGKTTWADQVDLSEFLSVETTNFFSSQCEGFRAAWDVFRVPPPTDLITVLQRLII